MKVFGVSEDAVRSSLNKSNFFLVCCFLSTVIGCGDMPEPYAMINELLSERPSIARRQKLISTLDTLSGQFSLSEAYFAAYYLERPHESWTLSGFFPENCVWPRDVQLCWAAREGTLQLANGGLSQLLYNTQGGMVVEIADWYRQNGHIEIAECLDLCREQLGEGFRDRAVRIGMLEDDQFRAKLEQNQTTLDQILLSDMEFDSLCDKTLIRCGITRLSR